jgi:hypothetical protein
LHKMPAARFVVGKLFKQLDQIHGFAVRLCDESAKMKLPRLQSAETSGCSSAGSRYQRFPVFFHRYYCSHVFCSVNRRGHIF